jgi:hypothetical protein
MARYFFHSTDAIPYRDAEGVELASDHAAKLEAVRLLGELLQEKPEALWTSASLIVTVTDIRDHVAFTLRAAVLDER